MKSVREYRWHGVNIKIQSRSSAKFLWLDSKLDILVNSEKVKHSKSFSFTQSSIKFSVPLQGQNLKGQIISKGLPLIPMRSQSIIIDDSILEKSHFFVGQRIRISHYNFLLIIASSLNLYKI